MKEIVVILDNIRSVLNVGAIFRTSDGAGVSKIYLTGITPHPGHKKLIKTALGAEDYIKWEYAKDAPQILTELKKEGFTIFAVEQTSTSNEYFKVSYPQKIALIFGHEITGVSSQSLLQSDKHIVIPMLGRKNSLNVATCAGIILYYIRSEELK